MRRILALPVLLAALLLAAACSPDSNPSNPAPSGSNSAEGELGDAASSSARPTATTPPPATAAALSLTASKIITDGSVGTRHGTLTLTIRNHGTTAPRLKVTFTAIPKVATFDGTAWLDCVTAEGTDTRTATCPIPAVAAGASSTVRFTFLIPLGQAPLDHYGTVTLAAVDATEADLGDNSAELSVCTNGCGG